eukprot:gene19154-25762_t
MNAPVPSSIEIYTKLNTVYISTVDVADVTQENQFEIKFVQYDILILILLILILTLINMTFTGLDLRKKGPFAPRQCQVTTSGRKLPMHPDNVKWVPDEPQCKLHWFDGRQMYSCLKGKRVVFAGDSLFRHMFYSFIYR